MAVIINTKIVERRSRKNSDLYTLEHLRQMAWKKRKLLTEKQWYVLRLRYGLGGGVPATMPSIAAALGVSRQRVDQLEKAALKRLDYGQSSKNGPAFRSEAAPRASVQERA